MKTKHHAEIVLGDIPEIKVRYNHSKSKRFTGKVLPSNFKEFVGYVEKDLRVGYKHNKRSIEALAYSLKISDRTEIK